MEHSPAYPGLNPEDLEKMIVRNYTGKGSKGREWTISELAEKLQVSPTTIRRVLIYNGIELRGRGPRAKAVDPETTLRRCRVCRWKAAVKNFAKDASKPGGYGYICNECNNKHLHTAVPD